MSYYNTQPNSGIRLTVPGRRAVRAVQRHDPGGHQRGRSARRSPGSSATAASGTPANAAVASANPGQTITLQGTGFTNATDVVFPVVDGNGNVSERAVNPLAVNAAGTQLTVVVPIDAVTGTVERRRRRQ